MRVPRKTPHIHVRTLQENHRYDGFLRTLGCVLPSFGAIAQLGEHLLCKQGVVGSIPTGSTSTGTTADGCVETRTQRLVKPSGAEAGVVFFENVNE